MKKLLKNKKAFTLVELMVVVAILGVLVAVAIPAYNGITAKAEENVCAANRKIVEEAFWSLKYGLAEISNANGTTTKTLIITSGHLNRVNGHPDFIDSSQVQIRQITRKEGKAATYEGLKCPTLLKNPKSQGNKYDYYPINPETGEVYCFVHKPIP